MPSFNLGPHPRMMKILEANGGKLKMTVPLTDFLEALEKHDKGYSWKDLAPDGVTYIEWYSLYAAYEEDEAETLAWRNEELERMNDGRPTSEESRDTRNRITDD